MVGPGPITQGKDFNFFQRYNVTDGYWGQTTGGIAPVIFNFKFQLSFSLENEGTDVIEYSFNGNTLHGDLVPGTPTEAIFFDNRRVARIWFRIRGGGNSNVRVEAWAGF